MEKLIEEALDNLLMETPVPVAHCTVELKFQSGYLCHVKDYWTGRVPAASAKGRNEFTKPQVLQTLGAFLESGKKCRQFGTSSVQFVLQGGRIYDVVPSVDRTKKVGDGKRR